MSRFHQRGRDHWSSRGAPRHYRLPLSTKPVRAEPVEAPVWHLALMVALFLGSAAFLFWCGTF